MRLGPHFTFPCLAVKLGGEKARICAVRFRFCLLRKPSERVDAIRGRSARGAFLEKPLPKFTGK